MSTYSTLDTWNTFALDGSPESCPTALALDALSYDRIRRANEVRHLVRLTVEFISTPGETKKLKPNCQGSKIACDSRSPAATQRFQKTSFILDNMDIFAVFQRENERCPRSQPVSIFDTAWTPLNNLNTFTLATRQSSAHRFGKKVAEHTANYVSAARGCYNARRINSAAIRLQRINPATFVLATPPAIDERCPDQCIVVLKHSSPPQIFN